MVDLISADQPTTREFPSHTVAVAPSLAGPWTDVPDLFCDSCRFVAGPEIDAAILSWRYGYKRPIGSTQMGYYYPFGYPGGWFVRITVDGVDTAWYGMTEDDARELQGSREQFRPSGHQTITAYGLGRLLERHIVASAVMESETISRGLSFNLENTRDGRGNRSASQVDGVYVFSDPPRNQTEWTVETAMRHLVKHHMPTLNGVTWEIVVDTQLLSRILPPTPTDRRSVKEIIDSILDRRRGIGYRIVFDPDLLAVQFRVFSFADEDVLDSDNNVLISRNRDQFDLNFENALDVVARLRYHWGTEYDEIIAEGERATSTITMPLVTNIVKDWSGAEGTDYIEAAKNETGYGDLDPDEQYRRNEAWRKEDRLSHVFSRFKIDSGWNQRNGDDDFLFPADDEEPTYDAGPPETEGLPLWIEGATLLPELPLKPRLDYSGTNIADETWDDPDVIDEFIPPFVYYDAGVSAAVRYVPLDKLPLNEDDESRGWSCDLNVLRGRPAFELRVSGGPQHLIAVDDWDAGTPGDTDPDQDPANAFAIDYTDCHVTLCIQGDHRASATHTIFDPPDRPKRTLRIYVPGMRLDYVVPGTTVGIADGALVTSDGGYVYDDRAKLQEIAELAGNWYSRRRATISMALRSVDTTFAVGYLIRSIGDTYDVPDLPPDASADDVVNQLTQYQFQGLIRSPVNSPVTLVEWDFLQAEQRIETAYAELDFAS